MSYVNDSIVQIKNSGSVLAIVYFFLLVMLIAVGVISAQFGIAVDMFTRDPSALFDASPFVGVISNIGVLFWCATVAICFFASAFQLKNGNGTCANFLIFSGLLTALLLFDDLFMLHETVLPEVLHIPEKMIYVIYLVLIALYFIKFRESLLQTEYIILFIACSFLGLSMVSDLVLPQEGIEFLIEDGFKLFGIVTWFIFFTRTCFSLTQKVLAF